MSGENRTHMVNLTKDEQAEVAAMAVWRIWGRQLGWTLYGGDGEHRAVFILPSGRHFEVTKEAKDSIDQWVAASIRGAHGV